MPKDHWTEFEKKMRQARVSEAAIKAFRHNYSALVAGDTGTMPENTITPVADLPRLEQIPQPSAAPVSLLAQTLVIKLNGGLGTSMGLERAKSLLPVKDGLTFLDFIAKQVLRLRQLHSVSLRFMLMNSFSTSADTQEHLHRYPELGDPALLELLQSQAPKVDASSFAPITWPNNPQLEWCPPGHGDIYPSLVGSGTLDRLLDDGVKYAFVSNSDNLGASLNLALLEHFAQSDKSFVMEVAERTPSDRKGGHLARREDRFILRESAQCPPEDMSSFQDISLHRFFNTNNLWLRLDHLRDLLERNGGFVPLPIIRNSKTVDPRDKNSPAVIQLETAMGAAIQCFENAGAVVVPRTRFAPVKTTSDLLALRSDAYRVTEDWRIVLATGSSGQPPAIELDSNHYKLVDQLDASTARGFPSLVNCTELKVQGPVHFSGENVFVGTVTIANPSPSPAVLKPGEYRDTQVHL